VSGKKRVNKDLFPVSYFYNSVLRSTHFKGIETQLLSFLSKKGHFWLLDFPLIVFVAILVIIALKNKKDYFYLTPLTLIGLTSIAVEIIVIIAFQTIYGYINQNISILFASFMAGMALGAYIGTKIKKADLKHLIVIQFQSLLLLLILLLIIKQTPPQLFFLIFLLLLGSVGGGMFIISNQLYLKKNLNYGL
jgi:spermidine synthase